ncbi:hypothetical protein F5876DRAFT_18858, partial [Lentinula aff. lateritia]
SQKFDTRLKTSLHMEEVCQEIDDQGGKSFWTYMVDSLLVFEEGGMSDEEDGEEDVVIDGVETKQDIKLVKDLWFRHESFGPQFQMIDETPKSEPEIFTQQGRLSVKRVRTNIIDKRDPPKGLPQDVFRLEYLQRL